jgi:hypothetical protein
MKIHYKYQPHGVVESDNYKLCWGRGLISCRPNRHVVLLENSQLYLIRVAVLGNNKYVNLAQKIKDIWRLE